jgi:hypothetical protein
MEHSSSPQSYIAAEQGPIDGFDLLGNKPHISVSRLIWYKIFGRSLEAQQCSF